MTYHQEWWHQSKWPWEKLNILSSLMVDAHPTTSWFQINSMFTETSGTYCDEVLLSLQNWECSYVRLFSTAYRKHACLKHCAQEIVIETYGCGWTYLTADYPQDVKTCGQFPDVYPPNGCIWTDNMTILEKQMDTCLEPLQKSLDSFIKSQILSYKITKEGNRAIL